MLMLVLVLGIFVGCAPQTISRIDRPVAVMSANDDVEMVFVPASEFIMGSEDVGADDDARPVAKIFVGSFWIDKFEVTNARYRRCVEDGACTRPVGQAYDDPTRANHPVTIISWQQAVAYCRWSGKRLPTESEWEKAARGTDGRRYPWGNRFDAGRANAGYTAGTTPVGSYPQGGSPYGVMDMAGNVWEWTSSLYKPYPYSPSDGRENLDARGARVNRGGSWYYGPKYILTYHRANTNHIYRRISDLGFRCAK